MPSNRFKIPDLPLNSADNFIRGVRVGGRKLCVIKDNGKYFVVKNRCPHAGGDLSGGWCENGSLICPLHRHAFDLNTGRGAPGQGNYIDTYPVELVDGELFVTLPAWWEFWK